jgi:1,4-alpha-glucan branching enzyme
VNPAAITIAEDMSGMPGMCLPIEDGGIGFDYRLAMGLPDMWIKAAKTQDEFWDINKMWGDMCLRRPGEGTVAYVESHDQALVGDQTMIFRLAGANMYTDMKKFTHNPVIDRAVALHKMIRLFTLAGGGEGYLNFMGNEFGHPEWIDFPREGNGWSYQHCRRLWSLADSPFLKYEYLNKFDKAMINLARKQRLFNKDPHYLTINDGDKVMSFERNGIIFAMNFDPSRSYEKYFVPTHVPGDYRVVLSTDDPEFGGHGRISSKQIYTAYQQADGRVGFYIYLPSRSAVVLKKKQVRNRTPKKK